MKALPLRGEWMLIPPDVAAEWAPVLLAAKDTFSADGAEAAERLDLLGAWFVKVSSGSSDVSKLDSVESDPAEWVSMQRASTILDITPQAVGRLRKRGSLHGEFSGGGWRICLESVNARKDGKKCPH